MRLNPQRTPIKRSNFFIMVHLITQMASLCTIISTCSDYMNEKNTQVASLSLGGQKRVRTDSMGYHSSQGFKPELQNRQTGACLSDKIEFVKILFPEPGFWKIYLDWISRNSIFVSECVSHIPSFKTRVKLKLNRGSAKSSI